MTKFTLTGKEIKMPFKWAGCPNAQQREQEVHYPCNLCQWELPSPEVNSGPPA